MKKILFICNEDFSFFHFRKDLCISLIKKGLDVSVVVPPGDYIEKIKSLGCKVHVFKFSRFISPFLDILFFIKVFLYIRKNNFDIVHNITIKPNIYGSIAAFFCDVPRIVSLISGAGYIFQEETSLKKKILYPIVSAMYRFALSKNQKVWFQNKDDLNEFCEKGFTSPCQAVLIHGSGINLKEFNSSIIDEGFIENKRKQWNLKKDQNVILMITARLIFTKGIEEFIEAARMNIEKKKWVFLLVSPIDKGTYDSLAGSKILDNLPANFIWEKEFQKDIKPFIKMSSIVVLPSQVREGVPRSLLEAMAFSKPIVTTNVIGCREVVEDGKNGFLVDPKNSFMLSSRIEELMNDEDKRSLFGLESLMIAKEKFSSEKIVDNVMNFLYEI